MQEQTDRLAATPSPLAGTYRFELTLPGLARPLVVFGRTEPAPHGPFWKLLGGDAFSPPPRELTPALGYQLRLIVGMDSTARAFTGGELAYFDVVDTVRRAPDGRKRWRGQTDVVFAVSRLITRGPLDSLLTAVSHDVDAVWQEEASGRMEGGWTAGPADRVDFTMRVERGGRTVFSMRGTRISRTTAPLKG